MADYDYTCTKAWTVRMSQVAKVSDLAQRLGINQSEVIRMAIDLLYEQETAKEKIQNEGADLAQRLGISKHEVLQQAIELFFEVKNDSDKPTQA